MAAKTVHFTATGTKRGILCGVQSHRRAHPVPITVVFSEIASDVTCRACRRNSVVFNHALQHPMLHVPAELLCETEDAQTLCYAEHGRSTRKLWLVECATCLELIGEWVVGRR